MTSLGKSVHVGVLKASRTIFPDGSIMSREGGGGGGGGSPVVQTTTVTVQQVSDATANYALTRAGPDRRGKHWRRQLGGHDGPGRSQYVWL